MLSAYVAFLIGYSPDLPLFLGLLVPLGFVAGYLFDRWRSVKITWLEDRDKIYRLALHKYFIFLIISTLFLTVGSLLASR
jgi:hypothetical protein